MKPTAEQLAPYIKVEIERIKINPEHPGIRIDYIRDATDRALKKYWKNQK